MVHFQGITVEIISDGQTLDFYDDPDAAGVEESRARHLYIEAVAGSTFELDVDITPEFNLYNMKAGHAVEVVVKIDGRPDSELGESYTKKYLQKEFSRGKSVGVTFAGPGHYCEETGQWMQSDYSFGNLVLRETSDASLSVQQAQDLGKIEVIVQRIKMAKQQTAIPSRTPIPTINEVPEKALKGRPIETTVTLTNARPATEPTAYIATPLLGEAGKPVVFNICYRSRHALQMLGCIPRSPSPAIEISDDESHEAAVKPENSSFMTGSSNDPSNTSLTGSAGSPGELLRQIQVLNARIIDLERVNVKAEELNSGTVIKEEGSSAKRKREEDGTGSSSQRRRMPAKIEHVDLTDD